jgi:anti-anti-sigma regulatory factor
MSFDHHPGLTDWRRRDRSSGASDLFHTDLERSFAVGAPGEPPAVSIQALRSASDADTLLVTIRGAIERAAAARVGDEVRDLLDATGATLVVCDVGGLTNPNAATVDALCRIRLAARRQGCRLRLRHASPDLLGLLDLMGLCDVVDEASGHDPSRPDGSGLEAEGQAEEREHASGVEEERDPADPTT